MNERDDGGPAFLHDRGGPYKDMWSGISVRDYFAAKAMEGLMIRIGKHDADLIAHDAYITADAMLKERAK